MKNRLILLNVLLLVLIGGLAWRYRVVWREAREREQKVLRARVAVLKVTPLEPAAPYTPVAATTYIDVAQKMLFSRDRNPNVIYAPPPPAPAPPPMPGLPSFFGLMTGFGDPGIILSEKPGASQKIYRSGDKIGAFKLVEFDSVNAVFDWEGKRIERRLEDLVAKASASAAAAAPAPGGASAGAAPTVTNVAPTALGPGWISEADSGPASRTIRPPAEPSRAA